MRSAALSLAYIWLVLVLLLGQACVLSSAAGKATASEKIAEELKTAIRNAKQGGAKKVVLARLKRAIENAKKLGPGVVDDLLKEAEDQLQGQSKADEQLQHARASLREAIESGDAPALEEALRLAKGVGLVRGDEVSKAGDMLESYRKEQKAAERREAKRAKLFRELDELTARWHTDVSREWHQADVEALQSKVAAAQKMFRPGNSTEETLIRSLESLLEKAIWETLPRDERLERSSTNFARDQCQGALKDVSFSPFAQCRDISSDELIKRSRAVGDSNCDHPTLKPDGPAPPQDNAAPRETSVHFCKYPPKFDLQEASDGKGYRMVEFEFPTTLFDAKTLGEPEFADLAVINLDMELFRSRVAPCGTKEIWLLEFYVHWCPHCQAVMPKLFKLGAALRAAGVRLYVGAVNCATEKSLCGSFQVMGHPLVAFFYGGIAQDGAVRLFEYAGRDLRVNSALDSLKKNADPSWFAGAPGQMPKHLFPAEMVVDLMRYIPEDYRPNEKVLRWLGNSSTASATACPDVRKWHKHPNNTVPGQRFQMGSVTSFPGNAWPLRDLYASAEQRLQDATQALVYTLEEWVVPNPAGDSPNGFAFRELQDLHSWVKLLVEAFPFAGEGGPDLRVPISELQDHLAARLAELDAADGHGALCIKEWRELVRPVRAALDSVQAQWKFVSACRTETCRVWTLLHTLSIARLARSELAGNSDVTDAPLNVSSNEATLHAMTAFLRRYFTCSTCRKHFLEQVEAGSYNLSVARSGTPRDLAIWWWRLHIAVSARVSRESKCKGDRRWPAADRCGGCWNVAPKTEKPKKEAGVDADESVIARELIREYWPQWREESDDGVSKLAAPHAEL